MLADDRAVERRPERIPGQTLVCSDRIGHLLLDVMVICMFSAVRTARISTNVFAFTVAMLGFQCCGFSSGVRACFDAGGAIRVAANDGALASCGRCCQRLKGVHVRSGQTEHVQVALGPGDVQFPDLLGARRFQKVVLDLEGHAVPCRMVQGLGFLQRAFGLLEFVAACNLLVEKASFPFEGGFGVLQFGIGGNEVAADLAHRAPIRLA